MAEQRQHQRLQKMETPIAAFSPSRHLQATAPPRSHFSMPHGGRASGIGRNNGIDSRVLGSNLSSLGSSSTGHVVVDLPRRSEAGVQTRATKDEKLGLQSEACFVDDLASPISTVTKNQLSDTTVEISRPQTPKPPEKPYHVFSKKQTWFVVIIIGAAGLFSGLSSNIYFPSLRQIATELNVSLATVSLTITSYLIVQGISPVIWGAFSDALGRRPIYIASFSVYILSNIVLSFSPDFAILLVFRGLQAAGSASTVSIGNGVIQDITPPATRGAYISFYQATMDAVRNFSIAIGPVLGGVLANTFGFRSVFVFLLIISVVVLVVIVVFLPETMRRLAGDGSLRLPGIYRPLIYRLRGEPAYMQPEEGGQRKKITATTFIDPLKLLIRKEILLNLVFGGVLYAIWSMVTSSTTGLFTENFHLNETLLGLSFLPNGLGTIIGSTIIGHLMTRDFKAAENRYREEHNLPEGYKVPAKNLPVDFPVEHARQRHLWWVTLIFIGSTGIYGFSLESRHLTSRRGWITVPLLLQFLIAATSNAVFAMNQTLISDMCPGKGASGTAINNLVRCSLGAIGVAVIETMISAAGAGKAFLALALVVVVLVPLVTVTLAWGRKWRTERAERNTSALADKA